METHQIFMYTFQKIVIDAKMQVVSHGFNKFKSEWIN